MHGTELAGGVLRARPISNYDWKMSMIQGIYVQRQPSLISARFFLVTFLRNTWQMTTSRLQMRKIVVQRHQNNNWMRSLQPKSPGCLRLQRFLSVGRFTLEIPGQLCGGKRSTKKWLPRGGAHCRRSFLCWFRVLMKKAEVCMTTARASEDQFSSWETFF